MLPYMWQNGFLAAKEIKEDNKMDFGDLFEGFHELKIAKKVAQLSYVKGDTLNNEAGKIAHKNNLNESDSEITTIVNTHCGIAAAAAITPVPGAAMVAAIANIWTMYSRINKKVGITIDEGKGKMIAKTIAGGLAANFCTAFVAGEALKFIPVFGSISGAAVSVAAAVFITRASAFLYMKVINLVTSDMSQDNLDTLVKETINENRDELKAMYEEEKRNQKNK